MPKVSEKQRTPKLERARVERAAPKKAEHLASVQTKDLPGHLPKITKLDVEQLAYNAM